MLDLRGATLAHEVSAPVAGPTLVWGHGLSSDRAGERAFPIVEVDALASEARIVRYDARNHGRSSLAAAPAGNSWEQMALDQLALADHLGIGHHVAGGASLGAATALWAATLAPSRIDALVLVIPPTGWETRAAQTDRYEMMAGVLERHGPQSLIDGLDAVPIPDPFADDPTWRDRSADRLRRADVPKLAQAFRDATSANLPERDRIADLDQPMLILAWTGDPGHPISTVDELRNLRPDAEVHVASTAADLGSWTDRVRQFLTGLA